MKRTVLKKSIVISLVVMTLVIGASITMFAAEKITLDVWINDFNPDSKDWINDELIPAFEKENPNIEINMNYIGWANHSEKFLTAWAAGEEMIPDVFEPALEQAGEMVAKDQVIPLNKYVEKWGKLDDLYKVGYEPYQIDGDIFTVPFRLDTRTVVYRKDIFKEVGLDPEHAPSNWQELKEAAQKLTIIKGGNRLVRAGFNPTEDPNESSQLYMEFLWQNGGEALNDSQDEAMFNKPEGIEALTFLKEVREIYLPEGVATLPETPIPYFAGGQTPLLVTGSAVLREVMRHKPEKFDEIGVGLPLKEEERFCNSFGGGFSISKTSKHPDESWKFIEFFLRKENLAKYNELQGNLPARKSLAEVAPFDEPQWQKFMEASKYAKIYPVIPEWWMLASKLGDELIATYRGKKTPAEALNSAAKTWNEVLQE